MTATRSWHSGGSQLTILNLCTVSRRQQHVIILVTTAKSQQPHSNILTSQCILVNCLNSLPDKILYALFLACGTVHRKLTVRYKT